MDIIDLIKNIPLLLSYFVPGYVFLVCFCFFSNKKINTIENQFISSIMISYIFSLFSQLLCTLTRIDLKFSIYISLLLSFALAFAFVKIYLSKFYKKIANSIGNVTGSGEIWEDLFDRKKGAIIRGYIIFENQDARIKGTVKYYQLLENGDCNIALWNYEIKNDNLEYSSKGIDTFFYIKASDIKGLEVFRGK